MKISFINVAESHVPNLGLAYVITAVEQAGHEPGLIDLAFVSRNCADYVLNKIEEQKPQILGFSTMTSNYPKTLHIARAIREKLPYLRMIWGGVHPTILPEETIRHPLVDAICIGEGERAVPEYLDKLDRDTRPDVSGIWHKELGKILKNPLRPFIQELDSIPFPNWDYWDVERYIKASFGARDYLYVSASRGCPYDCSFCSNRAIEDAVPGRYYRLRSPGNVVEEIKQIKERYWQKGISAIFFWDELFGLDKGWFDEFVELYKAEGLDNRMVWMCQTRADIITDEWARKAKEAGCVYIGIGLETGNEKLRFELYNKRISNETFRLASHNLKKRGILYTLFVIVGVPGETREDITCTMDFAESLRPFLVSTGVYVPLPKTKMGDYCRKTGLLRDDCSRGGFPRVETERLSLKELDKILVKLKILKLSRYLKAGVNYLGLWRFLIELIKLTVNLNHQRLLGFRHPISESETYLKTVLRPYIAKIHRHENKFH